MILALLALLVVQAGAQNSGAVTGTVRSAAGVPAAGVRVYAQQVRDAADANSPTAPLEGLTQTDASGRYRLELPTGRYYIGSGAVSSPTYYPGTTNVSAARTVLITSGGVVEGIDFASFVAATATPSFVSASPAQLFPALYGTPTALRLSGVYVWALPTSNVVPAGAPPPASYFANYSALRIKGWLSNHRCARQIPTTSLQALPKHLRLIQEIPSRRRPKRHVGPFAKIDSLDVEIPRPLPARGRQSGDRYGQATVSPQSESRY